MVKDFDAFHAGLALFKSADAMTYEDGYQSLLPLVDVFFDELVALLLAEQDVGLRAKYVELVGESTFERVVPLLASELSHPAREVRMWAWNQLNLSDFPVARAISAAYKVQRPDEDFF